MQAGQVVPQLRQQLQQVLAMQRHTQQMFELAGRDQQTRRRDKARDHRVAQKIGQKAQPRRAHHQHEGPAEQRQHQSRLGVSHAALRRHRAHTGRRHERGHRRRPHGQGAAAAHQGVQHQRGHAGIQARLCRQARQQRVGQTLWDQHQRHHHSGHAIGCEQRAVVPPAPAQNGEPALKCRTHNASTGIFR